MSLPGEKKRDGGPRLTEENFKEDINFAMANLRVSVELKDNLLEALHAIFRGNDLIAVLRTGYVKI